MAIFKSRFAIGDRVKIRYYSGTAVVAAVRFTKDKILYDVEREGSAVAKVAERAKSGHPPTRGAVGRRSMVGTCV